MARSERSVLIVTPSLSGIDGHADSHIGQAGRDVITSAALLPRWPRLNPSRIVIDDILSVVYALKRFNVTPIARVCTLTVTVGDPVIMLEEPIPATAKALARAGLSLADIDLCEVNEAFAAIPLAWLKATGADPSRLNVNGGAIALGHTLGASGTKLTATLIHALRARGARYGLQTMCERGGGIANATIFEIV